MKYLIQHFIEDSIQGNDPTNFGKKIAVKQGIKEYSYTDVQKLSHQFAHAYSKLGVKNKQFIGILSRVRVEAIAAMIAALRQGIVYVPLNIHAPSDWIGNIVLQSNIQVLIVDETFLSKAADLKKYGIQKMILLGDSSEITPGHIPNSLSEPTPELMSDSIPKRKTKHILNDLKSHLRSAHSLSEHSPAYLSFSEVLSLESNPLPEPALLADDLAYILYTSGSTGDPKGIMITHRAAYTFIDWMKNEFAVTHHDRILSRAPLQFDLSVFDIFTTFSAGGTLVIPDLSSERKIDQIVELMRREKITIIYTVPSAYIGMLTKGKLSEGGIPSLRWLLYAGEPFPTPYLRKVMECLPTTSVSNIYGPTETNIVTFYHLHKPPVCDDPIPIGKPVHDTEAYIVNENLQPVGPGEIGEILIRGGTVFAGYFNNSKLTHERLIQSPFHSYPTLCCRTGDYGRWLEDGNIAYHGRKDNMIKTRGYRVELGEVESALSACPGVDAVAVIPKPNEKYGNTLHAFLVLKKNFATITQVKTYIESKIPSYMIPYELIEMAELPKTATGKVDRVDLSKYLVKSKKEEVVV